MKIISKNKDDLIEQNQCKSSSIAMKKWPPSLDCIDIPDGTAIEAFNFKGREGPAVTFNVANKFSTKNRKGIEYTFEVEKVYIHNMSFSDTHCHCLIDILPKIHEIDESGEYDKIILATSDIMMRIIRSFKIEFKNVVFLQKRGLIFSAKKIYFANGVLSLYRKKENTLWMKKQIDTFLKTRPIPSRKKFIYCTRNSGGGASHGRKLTDKDEQSIQNISRKFCMDNDLEFVVFDGTRNDGERMNPAQQAFLFHSAKVVVGIHGGAMVNVINIPKGNKASVCEFTSGNGTNVQGVSGFGKNYNKLLAYVPEDNLDYYLIPYEEGSNDKIIKIDFENYKEFLKKIETSIN